MKHHVITALYEKIARRENKAYEWFIQNVLYF